MESKEIYRETVRHFLAPVLPLLDDPSVTEILINGHQTIYFERDGKLEPLRAGLSQPGHVDGGRPQHRRIHGPLDRRRQPQHGRPPARWLARPRDRAAQSARNGCCISIRKFKQSTFNLGSLVKSGSMSEEAREFLSLSVLLHKNTVIAGGTGSGKTSLLNALSAEIPENERIVVIEDSSELQLNQPHTVYLEAQPARPDGTGRVTIRDLFVDSLRMRPDRIVVGEIRRGEALDLVQSMISGHSGALTTVHATTANDAAIRLETLSLMSDVALPVHVARTQVASAIQLVVQISRFLDGSRKLRAISECLGLDDKGNYKFQDLYRFEARGINPEGRLMGELLPTGIAPTFADEVGQMGYQDRVKLTRKLFTVS